MSLLIHIKMIETEALPGLFVALNLVERSTCLRCTHSGNRIYACIMFMFNEMLLVLKLCKHKMFANNSSATLVTRCNN